ncbi:MAG: fused DSP-PTPase phosphatase/NAD kinase-like protein [Planctomycetota bacterium]|jgi:protein tyrosine phosphatase (PTP) superfamily phosphohydrolase (DUF442 family)
MRVRTLITSVALVALSGIACRRGPVESTPEGPPAATRPLASPRHDIPGLPNYARISPVLSRSGQPDAEGFQWLVERGVRTVVNLRGFHSDRDEMKGLGLRYAHIRFHTWHAEDEDIVKFLQVVKDPENQPVHVHCLHGSDRTGTVVAVYRMIEQGWLFEDAASELPRFGFHAVWANLKRYLKRYEPAVLYAKMKRFDPPHVDVVD